MDTNGYSFDGTGNGESKSGNAAYQDNLAKWGADGNGYLWNGWHVWLGQTSTTPNGPNIYTSDPNLPQATYWASRTVNRNSTFETNGYGSTFKGYTEGPGYWGKTFFM